MNCPSRTDETIEHPDWNQTPQALNGDLTTRNDFNGIVNSREQRDHRLQSEESCPDEHTQHHIFDRRINERNIALDSTSLPPTVPHNESTTSTLVRSIFRAKDVLVKYTRFIGPGVLIGSAYIDPGNYQTDVNAGASTRFSLLFIVLMSNLFAIFLQSLCIKLGSVTGLNLAENCRQHLPKWLNIILYLLSEIAIVATDMAEVIGSAIALNLLLRIPLVAGCCITVVDVLVILFFYRPDGSMGRLRLFEYFVMALVLGVVICFCIQLSYITNTTVGDVFRGYLPSSAVIEGNGVYLSCGILGATVMPHSIFLGSGVVQQRLREFDISHGNIPKPNSPTTDEAIIKYRPSATAIRSCLNYSIFELAFSLSTFALFVNSAILIVAGSSLYHLEEAQAGSLFDIHALLSHTIAPVAGTIFALALLLSGTSAGIVCTMAGQMVSEGMINWTIQPWLRRLLTRSISIVPSLIIAAAVGRQGLNTALTISQVILSVILPVVTAPLIYFTCRSRYMIVAAATDLSSAVLHLEDASTTTPPPPPPPPPHTAAPTTNDPENAAPSTPTEVICMKNSIPVAVLAIIIWLVVVVMNVALLVLVGMGKA